jgi:hypothetical protein
MITYFSSEMSARTKKSGVTACYMCRFHFLWRGSLLSPTGRFFRVKLAMAAVLNLVVIEQADHGVFCICDFSIHALQHVPLTWE